MIYTVTLNPAIDYIMNVDSVIPNAINRSTSERVYAGGKGINVSQILASLGSQTTALGFLAGFTGKQISGMVSEMGIRSEFVFLRNGFTRINVKLKGQDETDINGNGPAPETDEIQALINSLKRATQGDIVVFSGNVPKSIPADIYRIMMKDLAERGVEIVLDAEKKQMEPALQYNPFLVKPNDVELGAMFGKECADADSVIECAYALQRKGARNVLVSRGAQGAILLTETGAVFNQAAPKGMAVNTTGAGDSMVAGFLHAWSNTRNFSNALRLAVAAGSATAFAEGLANAAQINEVLSELGECKMITENRNTAISN